MNLVKLLKISDMLTFVNVISGFLCILFAALDNFRMAAILLFVAVLFDYFDGKSAKKRNIANEFGKELDSLSDIISFGVAPAVFTFLLLKDMRFVLIFVLYLLAGVIRLARFNVVKTHGHFEGMPITANGVVIPLLYFIVGESPSYPYYLYILLATFLMVSSIRFRKL